MTEMSAANGFGVHRVKRLVDAVVKADFSSRWSVQNAQRYGDVERLAKALEECVKDFEAFVRDHRSMDQVSLTVERIIAAQCSACNAEWETMDDEGMTYCASCGREVIA